MTRLNLRSFVHLCFCLLQRLWYRQRREGPLPPDALHFVDVVPQYLNPGEKHPKFDTLTTVLEKVNGRLRQSPPQGGAFLHFLH